MGLFEIKYACQSLNYEFPDAKRNIDDTYGIMKGIEGLWCKGKLLVLKN